MNMFSDQVQSRKVQRQATQPAVLDAAERLFHSRGFKDTTVRQSAASAGVGTGRVMAAGDRDSLLVSAMDRRMGMMQQERLLPEAGLLALREGNNAPEMIAALVQPFLQLFSSDMELAREYGAILLKGRHAAGCSARWLCS